MDPLSMTASIIALLELTAKLTSYINAARNATPDQAKVAVEASNLYSLLTTLRFRVDEARDGDKAWLNQVRLLGIPNGPLAQFKHTLETMVDFLASSRKRDQVKSALLWKFTKKEVETALAQMERLKSLINCALASDLLYVHPSHKLDSRVNNRSTLTETIQAAIVDLEEGTMEIQTRIERLQILADQELLNRLSRWLNIPDPSTNYHAALQKRHPETGRWLTDGQDFSKWKGAASSSMWLHGDAGCGKTILSTSILHDLFQRQETHSDILLSYFYFDFSDTDKQSSQNAIRSLLFQLAQQSRGVAEKLEKLYKECSSHGTRQPADTVVCSLIRDTLAGPEEKFIILDALDECTDRDQISTFLRELIRSESPHTHTLLTSRREKDIKDALSPVVGQSVNIQSAVVDADIRIYIHDQLKNDPKLKKWPDPVREEVMNALMAKAGGIKFRWVYCQLESLRKCITVKAVRKALSSLPKTLDETYNRILQDLDSADQLQNAISVLRWLCFSDRPFRLDEMIEILAIDTEDRGGFDPENRLPDPNDIMVVCSSFISLVVIDQGDYSGELESSLGSKNDEDHSDEPDEEFHPKKALVQLAHFSVKEFLLSDRCEHAEVFQPELCHGIVAKTCLKYLLYAHQACPMTEEQVRKYPLSLYAAEWWWQHFQDSAGVLDAALSDLISHILTNEGTAFVTWLRLYDMDTSYGWRHRFVYQSVHSGQPLYYAALIGVPAVAQMILDAGANVNGEGGRYGNALQAASYNGHENLVHILLDAGADINAQGGDHGYALQAASLGGDEKIVQILLDAGADVNAQGGHCGYALQAASFSSNKKIVQILLDAGADINAQGGDYGYALQAASRGGDEKIVQILLDAGADINAQGGRYGNALQAASYNGHENLVHILLDAGADINAQGGDYGYALQAASFNGNEKTVQTLLDAGADINAQGGHYGYALQAASYRGNEKIIQILLDAGADINAQGGHYGYALQAASYRGNEKIIQILLDAGADVTAQGGQYGSALQAAAGFFNHEEIVQILLDAGADVNARGGQYGSALQAAAGFFNHEGIVQILLDAGAEVNARDERYRSALLAASVNGHEEIVQMLLARGAVWDTAEEASVETDSDQD